MRTGVQNTGLVNRGPERTRMTKAQRARVVNATVRIEQETGNGQGVLVSGDFILTATHCISWNGEGGMAMGDNYIEKIVTESGTRLRVGPLAADPVSDLAVLGSLDDQTFLSDSRQFEEWCEATPALTLATETLRFRKPYCVHILTHKREWVDGVAIQSSRHASCLLYIEAASPIEGGTSGGPVLDTSGRLVGIVSHFSDAIVGEKCTGSLPIARLALPRWVWSHAIKKQKGRL